MALPSEAVPRLVQFALDQLALAQLALAQLALAQLALAQFAELHDAAADTALDQLAWLNVRWPVTGSVSTNL